MSKSQVPVLIKKPYQSSAYTLEQMVEFARCADPVTGPQHFLTNYFYIQHPVRGRLKYKPYEYQERLYNIYHRHRYSISMLPRQSGKTATAAGYLLWYAMFVPDSTVLIAAHKYSGAQEIMQRVRYAYEMCPDFIRAGAVSYNKGSIDFDNGSRMISQATTENTGRGMAISLLYLDEFSFVRPNIAREFWTSISPTLSTGGKAIITSTPNSDEDQFADIWRGANKTTDEHGNETEVGVNGFKAFRAYWWEHPDRDEAWARSERAKLGDEKFLREMECEFIRADETLINPIKLNKMEGKHPLFKEAEVRWYKQPDTASTFIVSLDPSLGTGGDPAAIQVIEMPSCDQVAEWQHNKTPIDEQIRILKSVNQSLVDKGVDNMSIYYSIENNTIGEAGLIVINEFGEENIPGIFLSEPAGRNKLRRYRKGFTTTNPSKLSACAKLKQLIESGRMVVSSKNLLSELKNFIAAGTSYKAKIGETDDLVSALLLAVRIIQLLQSFDSKIDTAMRDVTLDAGEFVEPLPFIVMR